MRRFIALFAVLIGAFGVIGLAGASPAAAADCQYTATPVRYDSGTLSWVWEGETINCTGVNAVSFALASGTLDYMVDVTHGHSVHFPYAGGGIVYAPHYPTVYAGPYWSTYYFSIWGAGCPNIFWEQQVWAGNLHNVNNGGSWGPGHNYTTPQQPLC